MKRTGSYDSIIRGVSQQVPHDRIIGQHWEQVNLISDPVRGLARRHGSFRKDSASLGRVGLGLSPADIEDATTRGERTLFIEGVEYSFNFTTGAEGSTLPVLVVVNKDTGKFVPVSMSPTTWAALSSGITTACAAGRYVLLGLAGQPATATTEDGTAATADVHAVWIRGGAYSRTFSVSLQGGATYEYTTMESYYAGTLDLSGLDPKDEDYVQQVNERQAEYSTAVNQHIAASAKDIVPSNVAQKLVDAMVADGVDATRHGAHIIIRHSGAVTADDDGNGDYIRVVSRTVTSSSAMTLLHEVGKVVKVSPTNGSDAYYLRAENDDGETGIAEVVWREAPGVVVTPTFIAAAAKLINGEFEVVLNLEDFSDHTPDSPTFYPSRSGDLVSQPLPDLFGRVVTHMQMLQDRLMVVAGSTVLLSVSGDYFNFFRKSAITLQDDDPIEMYAQGNEDDVITSSAQMDRNVILFGRRNQYLITGNSAITPSNAFITAAASYEGGNVCPPTHAGGLVFFTQRRERRLTLQQMQPGQYADKLDAFDISTPLDGYLSGTPTQIIAMTSPSLVVVKTKEYVNGFYTYSFLDTSDQAERIYDSWSRWEWHEGLGYCLAVTPDDSGILAVYIREVQGDWHLVLDRFSRETDVSDYPYLDSQQVYDGNGDSAESVVVSGGTYHLIGSLRYSDGPTLAERYPDSELVEGFPYRSLVDITAPYVRDRVTDKAILTRRLTVTAMQITFSNSAAAEATLRKHGTSKTVMNWIARPAGSWVLNTQQIEEVITRTIPIMSDNKGFRLEVFSRNWLPMTLSSIEWTGQQFR